MRSDFAARLLWVLTLSCGWCSRSWALCKLDLPTLVWPSDGLIPSNGVIALWGYGTAEGELKSIEVRAPRLVSEELDVELELVQRYEQWGQVAVLLRPTAPLPQGVVFLLRYEGDQARASAEVPLATFRVVEPDASPPSFTGPPAVIHASRSESGCAPDVGVELTETARDAGPLLYEVRLSETVVQGASELPHLDALTPPQARPRAALVVASEGRIALGHGHCRGSFELESGVEYNAEVTAIDWAGQRADAPSSIRFGAPAPTTRFQKQLAERPIRIRVLDHRGRPLPGARVAVAPADSWVVKFSEAEGVASFDGLTVDPVPVIVDDRRLGRLLLEANVGHDGVIVARFPNGSLRGRVVDASGAAVASLPIWLTPTRPRGRLRARTRPPEWVAHGVKPSVAMTDPHGRFEFLGLDPGWTHSARTGSSASGQLGSSYRSSLDGKDVLITLRDRGPENTVRGQIHLASGSYSGQWVVGAIPTFGTIEQEYVVRPRWSSTPVSTGERFEISGLGGGSWIVFARALTDPGHVPR